ncbi:MAG TPA: hypothetical protein VFG04_00710 [Planctomycetaceae bacterium]|jgi:hypothetical protein|nr:hypothetical protein [Planctomycetaceae bacterium]
MTRSRFAMLAVVAIPLALVFCLTLRADPPQLATPLDDPFAGKILVLDQRSNPTYGATLEEVHLKRVGEQTFLVGKGFAADAGKGWYNGRTVWIALNDVSRITEFEDRSDLSKAKDNQRSAGN